MPAHLFEGRTTSFPSPAEDYREVPLSLDDLLIWRPASTFLLRAGSNEMAAEGIRRGDLLVIDRACQPLHNALVVAADGGQLCIRRLLGRPGAWKLQGPEGPRPATEDTSLWGVITAVVHRLVVPTQADVRELAEP
jgi:DNA polymerase V